MRALHALGRKPVKIRSGSLLIVVKSPESLVHCFVRSGRLNGNQALVNTLFNSVCAQHSFVTSRCLLDNLS